MKKNTLPPPVAAAAVALALTLAALAVACGPRAAGGPAGGASVSAGPETIKTYPYGDPDPVPIFGRSGMWGQGQRLYPYFSYNGFSAKAEDRPWTVVRLENPYIRVAVLPDVGGKVWGASDKATGREFLYTNHVMKFREIALRGPWTSGGIEFNFGVVGHAPTTASPVDYVIRHNPDGSASCVVGALDLPSRTRWSVTITLPKDKAYFETNGFWHNPTPFSQSYYYWSCAAIKTADDLRYIFPGRYQIGHDYSVPLEPWPVTAEGRDLSWYKNNDSPSSKSYFTVGEYADYYGAWYKNADAGFGHWARYDDMPGRKVWIWDLSRQGEIWADLLTDSDGQYSEPQAGRLLNQSDHGLLAPALSDRWRELWFPYRGIGPMTSASPLGVLSTSTTASGITLAFFPVGPLDEDMTVVSAGRELLKEHLRLTPEESFRKEIPWQGPAGPYEVKIGGTSVYSSDPKAAELTRPLRFRAIDETTGEGLFLAGLRLEQERNYGPALEKYNSCLVKEPLHLRALARAAELYGRRGEYAKGLELAAKALANSMYDPEANYVYGVVARRLGKTVDAKETLGWASRSAALRSPAFVQLAEIALAEGNNALAVEYAEKASDANRYNSSAKEIAAVAFRRLGSVDKSLAALADLDAFDPLDHLLRFERYLLDPTKARLDEFKSMIRNELPVESYLEMAQFYLRTGGSAEALRLLELAPSHPEVFAWLGYLVKDTDKEKSAGFVEKSLALPPFLVFPYREESIPVFQWLAAEKPDDWKPKYYLGLIYWGKGRTKETLDLFRQCDKADYAPFFMARAGLYREAAPDKAMADLRRAVDVAGRNWRAWHELIGFERSRGRKAEALGTARKAASLFPDDVRIQVDLAGVLTASSLFEESAAVLERVQALPYEGASGIHGLYVETHMGGGLARMEKSDWAAAAAHFEKAALFPEALGTGAPFAPDVRAQQYFEAVCRKKLGDKDGAARLRKAVADFTRAHPKERGPNAYFGALVLQASGDYRLSREVLKSSTPPSKALVDAATKWRL